MEEKNGGQDLFQIVGADYQKHEPVLKKTSFLDKIKEKPVLSVVILLLIICGCLFSDVISNHDPTKFYLEHLNEAPNSEFFFGTDSMGRDIFSLIWNGGRASIFIGLMGAAITTVIGITYGCVSGVANEHVDSVMMRITEIAGSIPSILLVLLLTSFFQSNNVWTLSFAIGVLGWFNLARIVRGEVRQIRNQEYVLMARSFGAGFGHIMKQHLIPNFISAIMFVVVSSVSSSMTTEATLSFLGLGLPVEVVSWGSMLSLANRALMLNTWWVIIIPGVFLVITLMCITNIGHYLRKEVNRRPSNL